MTNQRVLRDVQSSPSVTFMVGSTPTDPDGSTATVTITRADGTVVGTDLATVRDGTGVFHIVLAPQSDLGLFTYKWKGTFSGVVQYITTKVEVVGDYVVSLADLKAEQGLSTRTDAQLAEARQWFEDMAEAWCGVAFVPRFARDVTDGDGSNELLLRHHLPTRVLACSIGGTAQTGLTTWDVYDDGRVIRDTGAFALGRNNVAISYEHGFTVVDSDVREAALTACRTKLLSGTASGGIPSGVTQLITDAGTMNFGRPSRPTGLNDVDLVLNARRILAVA